MTKKPAKQQKTTLIKTGEDAAIATLSVTDKAIAVKIARKDNPEFSQWFEQHAEASLIKLFDQWQDENGSGK